MTLCYASVCIFFLSENVAREKKVVVKKMNHDITGKQLSSDSDRLSSVGLYRSEECCNDLSCFFRRTHVVVVAPLSQQQQQPATILNTDVDSNDRPES